MSYFAKLRNRMFGIEMFQKPKARATHQEFPTFLFSQDPLLQKPCWKSEDLRLEAAIAVAFDNGMSIMQFCLALVDAGAS